MKRIFSLTLLTLALTFAASGCKKKAAAVPEGVQGSGEAIEAKPLETTGTEIIPGENAVKQAMAQKDYERAIQQYTALKAAVASPEQNDEYLSLYGQIRSELTDASATNPKAAEALRTLTFLRNAR